MSHLLQTALLEATITSNPKTARASEWPPKVHSSPLKSILHAGARVTFAKHKSNHVSLST